ncbi:hypothetical protein ACVXHB_22315 [Escherichia coli]
MKLFRILDPFTLTLITVVLLASFFPARGDLSPSSKSDHRSYCPAVLYARRKVVA